MSTFAQLFGAEPSGTWDGPGRVNLIGEHTDYNEGFVLPFAIERRARVSMRLRDDGVIRCASQQRGTDIEIASAKDLRPGTSDGWVSYVLGVAWALGTGVGFDLLVDSDVPIGAGLSSSAALETATALALNDLARAGTVTGGAGQGLPHKRRPSSSARRSVSWTSSCRWRAVGGPRPADRLPQPRRSQPVPLDPSDLGCDLIVIDTGVAHVNTDGAYAERRAACEKAAADLGVRALRDAHPVQVDDRPWARHVVTENARVLDAVEALRARDPQRLGALMTASHASLRDDFQVSSQQLDIAVDAAVAGGAHGAKLSGAGFGGSVIALVPAALTSSVTSAVEAAFVARGFAAPKTFIVTPGPGAARVA